MEILDIVTFSFLLAFPLLAGLAFGLGWNWGMRSLEPRGSRLQ